VKASGEAACVRLGGDSDRKSAEVNVACSKFRLVQFGNTSNGNTSLRERFGEKRNGYQNEFGSVNYQNRIGVCAV